MPHGWLSLLSPATHIAAAGLLLFAALHDIVARTVPNGIAVWLALMGLIACIVDNNLLIGSTAAVIVFAIAAFCWRRGWLGGADVKLMGASVLAVPSGRTLAFVVAMSVAGSILAALYLAAGAIVRRRPRPARQTTVHRADLATRAIRAELWRLRRGGPLPYACAIAAGFLFVQF
ncbi:MAG: A24 family peptidase [Rhodospirillales bacterium]